MKEAEPRIAEQAAVPGATGRSYPRLVMLGTAARGGITAVVDVYRAQGLFGRWPIRYAATHRDAGAASKLLTALRALLVFASTLARDGRVVMHVHCALRASFWRKAIFMSMAMLAGCPVIFHLHGGGFKHFYETECGALRRRIIRFFLDRSTYIIVLSERWRAWIDGISANRSIVCIPNPVAVPEGPSPRPRENLVLFLGRLERNKGVFDLLDAVSRAQKQIPDLRLVCAGDGDIESATRYAEKVSVRGAVSFPGWIGPAEKQSLMDRAAVCVLPSYAEGLPMSLLEAMACGLPVIATDVGGIPDLVADGVSGLLYTPGDIATLERLLCGLMRDPELGKRMALAARETVRLRFDAASAVAQLEEIYASVGLTPSGVRVRTPVDRLHEAA